MSQKDMFVKMKRVLAFALVTVLFCGTLCSCSIEAKRRIRSMCRRRMLC